MEKLIREGLKIVRNEPMSRHTTWGIGGPADWYAEVFSVDELARVTRAAAEQKLPVFFLGAGSNLLVSDRGMEGLVLRLRGDFESVTFSGTEARAGSGVLLPVLARQCADRGLGGIEPLVGVPGTVGGALVMNAGTRELEIGRVVLRVETLSDAGRLETIPADKIRFEYRASSLQGRVICFATLQLQPADKDDIIRTVQEFLSRRLETQPIGTQNCGSVFRNPEGRFAAQLIEQAGFKGRKHGRAQVSPKHANFIVNCGGAAADEVKGLIFEIRRAVLEKCGVELETEVKMVGRA